MDDLCRPMQSYGSLKVGKRDRRVRQGRWDYRRLSERSKGRSTSTIAGSGDGGKKAGRPPPEDGKARQ